MHGVGYKEADGSWDAEWQQAIKRGFAAIAPDVEPTFDWSPERAVTDDWFCELYSQLPYETQFIAVLDCCHSGGMTRHGAQKVRGLTPSDDIRHRSLRWDKTRGMWIPRDLQLASRHLLDSDARRSEFLGSSGAIKRLGRAVPTWTSARRYREATDAYGHKGPYVPILLEACQEGEYAYEYRHGATSYGAFTYSLVHIFRQAARSGKGVSWEVLMQRVGKRLKELEYRQMPVLICPRAKQKARVPR